MSRLVRILYAAMGEAWSARVRGAAYEDRFFREPLRALPGVSLEHFDYAAVAHEFGRERMSRALVELAEHTRPDLLFLVPCDPAVDPLRAALAAIPCPTLAWICDDPWQFEQYSRLWAAYVDWLVTTDPDCVPRYAALGVRARVILSQWAVDETVYTPGAEPQDLDLAFVGQPHGDRRAVIASLRAAGLRVATFGHGWEGSARPVAFADMLAVFRRAKINLNLAQSLDGSAAQIKARLFEVTACGGFLLTAKAPHLERYFTPGVEIATFADRDEMVEKARHHLAHDDERRAIAARGRARCLREHTWRRRLTELLAAVGR
jgi:spore maturation protein CgeB